MADVYGIYTRTGDVDNTGTIALTSTGGTAEIHDIDTISATASIPYAQAYAIADSEAYGIYSDDGDINNTGSIGVTSTGGTARIYDVNAIAATSSPAVATASSHAQPFGIYAFDGNVNNSGSITVTSTGGTAEIHDINAISSESSYGNATAVVPALADGIYAYNGDINNIGSVTVTGTGGTVEVSAINASSAGTSSALVHGVRAYDGAIDNAGSVTVTGAGGTVQISDVNGVSTPSSVVSGSTYAEAYGLYTFRGDINNTGAITVASHGGMVQIDRVTLYSIFPSTYSPSNAYGIYAYDGDIGNTDSIDVTSTGSTVQINDVNVIAADSLSAQTSAYSYAYGIYAHSGEVNNTGSIAVTSTGGTVGIGDVDVASSSSSSASANAYAKAFGIYAEDGDVTNTGTIAVTALGGTATIQGGSISATTADANACAYGIYAYDSVYNSGAITVIATGGTATADDTSTDSYAYGIYMTGNGTLTNTGTIRASGDQAYELYVASRTTTLVDTYNVTLDGDPNDASLGIAADATLVLNNATLSVTDITGETLWDTEYQLFDIDPNGGAVTGLFGDVAAVNPDAKATYHDQGTSVKDDDTVSLAYSPEATETEGSVSVEKQLIAQSMNVVHHRMTSTLLNSVFYPRGEGLLADADPTDMSLGLANSAEGEDRSSVFVEPYYSRMDKEADPLGYDARLWGFAAGCEHQMDNTLISLHAGYGRANIDYTGTGYSNNGEDQDLLTGGIAGLTRWDNWTLRYGVTGFYGWHDYHGLTGGGLTETEAASINSYGMIASVMAGHLFQRGSHVLLPEVGMNYLWGHRQRYTTEASDPDWDTTFSAMDDHDVEAEAALHWLTGFMHKNIHVTPAASIGIRHLLTDDESLVRQSVPGAAPVSVKSERDRTAMTLSGSILLTKARHSLSLAYDGEYSRDTDRHSVWLRYGWQF